MDFLPHSTCYLNDTRIILLHVVGDTGTALAYLLISVSLWRFTLRRRDLPFSALWLMFAAFILSCGATHASEAWSIFSPIYYTSGALKLLTAFISIVTALCLPSVLRQALLLPSPAQLQQANEALSLEMEHRCLAEVTLNQRTKVLTSMLNALSEAVIVTSLDDNVLEYNPAAVRLVGPRPPSVSHWQSSHPVLVQQLRAALQGRCEQTIVERADGSGWLSYAAKPIYDEVDAVTGALAIVRDVTHEQLAQHGERAALASLERRVAERTEVYSTLLESIPQIVWTADANGTTNYFNDKWYAYTGLSEEQSLGWGWIDALHPEDRDATTARWTEATTRLGKTYELEYRFRGEDGTYRWHLGRGVPLKTQDGSVARWFGTCTDIHDQKEAMATLRLFNEELEEGVRLRTRQLRQALEDKELLLREVHHRVKNNLQVISSLLNIQARNVSSEEPRRVLLDCRERVSAIALVHEQLYSSHSPSEVDFRHYVVSLCEQLSNSLGVRLQQIRVRLELDEVKLSIDKAVPCGLVLNELVTNALKHAFDDSQECREVLIQLSNSPLGEVTLQISDSGKGMSLPATPGGFGMTMVKMLTRQLGGSFRTTVEHGTTHTLVFTCHRDHDG